MHLVLSYALGSPAATALASADSGTLLGLLSYGAMHSSWFLARMLLAEPACSADIHQASSELGSKLDIRREALHAS